MAPFPAPPSQTVHEVLPHTAFHQAVDQPHSATPPALTTDPSDPRSSSTHRVLAVAAAHLAGGPSLRRVVLSTPIIATYGLLRLPLGAPPLRGTTAYRLRCYRALRVGSPQPLRRCRDGSLLFHDGLCDRSVPHRPAGSWVLRFQGLRTVHGLRPCGQGSAPACFPLSRGGLRPGRIPRRTDRSLACRPRRRCRGASTVGSPLPPATSYRAAWPLPRPDSHRQVHRSFPGHTPHLPLGNVERLA